MKSSRVLTFFIKGRVFFFFFFSNFTSWSSSELQINVFKSVMPGQCMLVVLLRKIIMVFPAFEWIRISRKHFCGTGAVWTGASSVEVQYG